MILNFNQIVNYTFFVLFSSNFTLNIIISLNPFSICKKT